MEAERRASTWRKGSRKVGMAVDFENGAARMFSWVLGGMAVFVAPHGGCRACNATHEMMFEATKVRG